MERIKPGLVVSLGVVDVSTSEPESVEALLDRLDPVVEQCGEDDVAISTNAGTGTSAHQPDLSVSRRVGQPGQ